MPKKTQYKIKKRSIHQKSKALKKKILEIHKIYFIFKGLKGEWKQTEIKKIFYFQPNASLFCQTLLLLHKINLLHLTQIKMFFFFKF